MNITIRLFLLLLSVLFFSCEEQPLFVKCDECVADEPINAELSIKLDLSRYGVPTLINVYAGNLEDSIMYRTFYTTSNETSVKVTLNQKYTVTASYYIDGTFYIAVDSATPRVTYSKDQCTDPCYYIYDREVNLKLKYTYKSNDQRNYGDRPLLSEDMRPRRETDLTSGLNQYKNPVTLGI